MEERGDEVVFDGRNAFEAKIGKFKNAIVPMCAPPTTSSARSSPASTITLRTSRLSPTAPAVFAVRFFPRLHGRIAASRRSTRLIGGIVRYGEKYGDKELWEGSLYVFDKRMHMEFTRTPSPSASANSAAPLEQVRELL